jgi:hypothetical protein
MRMRQVCAVLSCIQGQSVAIPCGCHNTHPPATEQWNIPCISGVTELLGRAVKTCIAKLDFLHFHLLAPQTVGAVTPYTYIPEVPHLNLGRGISYQTETSCGCPRLYSQMSREYLEVSQNRPLPNHNHDYSHSTLYNRCI